MKKFIFIDSKQTNQSQKTIELEYSGQVILKKSSKAKYLGIRIKPFVGVIVTVPKRVSYWDAKEFAKKNDKWIFKHLSKMEKFENEQPTFDENTTFKTKEHKLIIIKSDIDKTRIRIANSEIVVNYPSTKDVNSNSIQADIKLAITEAFRIEAKKYLPQRVNELSNSFGISYNRLFLKNLKSRWGSCSMRNNINLNIHLMQLPNELIDYVILHELTHTIHKNHSKIFWNALDKIFPESKIADKKLKGYSPLRF